MTKELPLCECGCGQEVKNPWNKFIRGHHSRCMSDETKKKISKAHKGKIVSEETRKKLSKIHKGKIISEETKKKMSKSNSGHKRSEETKRKMREAQKGKIGHWLGKKLSEEHKQNISESQKGKIISEESRKKMSESHKGQKRSGETKRKISEGNKGKKNGNWNGGISYEPYCIKFSCELKERVREFFGRKCFECLITEENYMNRQKENGKQPQKLIVHHVNYDKMVCCNDVTPLFVPLCSSCHGKTNSNNRNYWEEKYTRELMERTDGKCFIPLYLMELMEDNVRWIQCLDECK